MYMNLFDSLMKKLLKATFILAIFTLVMVQNVTFALAQIIPTDKPRAATSIGNISNLEQLLSFAFNALRYFGWAGVILGVAMAIFGLIYKLFAEDNDKVIKTVQGYITKAIVIVVAGILLISAGFIVQVVGQVFGVDLMFNFSQGLR